MKTPKAKRLPSGSWFVRVRVNGQDIGITKRTEKEAIAEAMAVKAGIQTSEKIAKSSLTVGDAVRKYIEIREKTLSPSTVRGYREKAANHFQSIARKKLSVLTDLDCQAAINAERCGPKTIKNAWTLFASAIEEQTGRRPKVHLPAMIKNEHQFLQPDEVHKFLEAAEGDSQEIAILLGLHSLRRSEILSLQWTDIDLKKDMIHVRGAVVYDSDGNLIRKKANKNEASRRDVPIMIPRLRALLVDVEDKSGPVVNCYPNTIQRHVDKICEAAGLPKIGTHGLRHSFASIAYHIGMPEKISMEIGGWSDFQTMRNIYTHIAKLDISKYSGMMKNFYEYKNGNENDNE